jgi:hypothetical protein
MQQNDFIERKTLLKKSEETFFYDIYQTGIDNYDFIFFSGYRGDTSEVFKYSLNDATYKALKFNSHLLNDTLFIITNMPLHEHVRKSKAGTVFYFSQKK